MRRLMVLAASIAVLLVGAGASPARPTQAAAMQGRWVMRDLGRFGKNSYSEAVAINDRGQVVCDAWVGGNGPITEEAGTPPERHTAFVWEGGKSSKLTLGGTESKAAAINEEGQVVGWADTTRKDKDGDPISHAFLWQNGTMTDLGTLGGRNSEAVAINDRGQVVGSASTRAGLGHAFLWENGKMTDLGTFGGKSSEAVAINNRGQVVVEAYIRTNPDLATIYHNVLWERGKTRDIGTLKDRSQPFAVNDHGQVVGNFKATARPLGFHAFLFQNGKLRDLGTLGGPASAARAINELGEVVGSADTKAKNTFGGQISRAFLWENRKMRPIGDFDPVAINDRGQVVGDNVLWQKGKMTALSTPRRLDGFAVAINERGQVVGNTKDNDCYNGCPGVVLWTFKP